jgi:hypothetical protein
VGTPSPRLAAEKATPRVHGLVPVVRAADQCEVVRGALASVGKRHAVVEFEKGRRVAPTRLANERAPPAVSGPDCAPGRPSSPGRMRRGRRQHLDHHLRDALDRALCDLLPIGHDDDVSLVDASRALPRIVPPSPHSKREPPQLVNDVTRREVGQERAPRLSRDGAPMAHHGALWRLPRPDQSAINHRSATPLCAPASLRIPHRRVPQ